MPRYKVTVESRFQNIYVLDAENPLDAVDQAAGMQIGFVATERLPAADFDEDVKVGEVIKGEEGLVEFQSLRELKDEQVSEYQEDRKEKDGKPGFCPDCCSDKVQWVSKTKEWCFCNSCGAQFDTSSRSFGKLSGWVEGKYPDK